MAMCMVYESRKMPPGHFKAEQQSEAFTTETVVKDALNDTAEAVLISFIDLWLCEFHLCLLNLLSKFTGSDPFIAFICNLFLTWS